MSLSFRLDRISPAAQGTGFLFEVTLQNGQARSVDIYSFEFELWLLMDRAGELLSKLSPDSLARFSEWTKLEPFNSKALKLLWPYTARQLQQIEDWRRGGDPVFEIRGQVGVMSNWPARDGFEQMSSFVWEYVYSVSGNQMTYPLRIPFPQSQWTTLLDQVGFQHIVLLEFPLPDFVPGFARSRAYLQEAWRHHRAGATDESLLACRKAFECLGFNLFGEGLERRALLDRLMPEAPREKVAVLEAFWAGLQNLMNLAVHERGRPIELTHADSEMALVAATAILCYLAKVK